MLFFLFCCLFLFLAAPASAVDVREMSIDEYVNFVNPPPVHKYQTKFGDSMLCVKFSDQISVKYAQDNITRGLEKPPKLNSSLLNISNFGSGGVNISKLGVKSECPDDTVAIREIKREDVERAGSVSQFLNRRGIKRHNTPDTEPRGIEREYAVVRYVSEDYPITGFTARFNIWSPNVAPDASFSLSQFWLINKHGGKLEVIEAGWIVYPSRFRGDARPRFFTFWTPDDYESGCYDEQCPGFVSIPGGPSHPGLLIGPVSQLGENQYDIQLSIQQQVREDVGLAWVLLFENVAIGYWPASLFRHLATGADEVQVGGEVAYYAKPPGTRLSKTEMGSGRFPWSGYRYTAYTKAIQIFGYDGNGIREIHPPPQQFVTKPECYYLRYTHSNTPEWGKHIFFGGPGGRYPECVV